MTDEFKTFERADRNLIEARNICQSVVVRSLTDNELIRYAEVAAHGENMGLVSELADRLRIANTRLNAIEQKLMGGRINDHRR